MSPTATTGASDLMLVCSLVYLSPMSFLKMIPLRRVEITERLLSFSWTCLARFAVNHHIKQKLPDYRR
jgi:hypothetical protein